MWIAQVAMPYFYIDVKDSGPLTFTINVLTY